ncbi:MAG: CPBP family intramembrane glutamic endopeptidase [Lysobacteraceae bacterium]
MNAVDLLFFLLLFVVQPVTGAIQYRRYVARIRAGAPANRLGQYRSTERIEWIGLLVLLLVWWWFGRDWAWLGLTASFGIGFWIGAGVLLVATAVLAHGIRGAGRMTREQRDAQASSLGDLVFFLPTTRPELRMFRRVSLAAGVAEEVVYRGYVIWLLGLFLPVWSAVLLSSVAFGLAHSYQGASGSLRTGLVGLAMALLYVGSGSIWLPILAHILLDLLQGEALYRILRRDNAAPAPAPAPA